MSNNDESLGVAAITNSTPQAPQDTFQIFNEKSLSVFDRTHRFVANYLYEVPAPGFANNNGFLRQIFDKHLEGKRLAPSSPFGAVTITGVIDEVGQCGTRFAS